MTAERAAFYRAGLRRAVAAGRDVLAGGGSALDAVTASVCALEDDPLFNAGRGAVFTRAGTQEIGDGASEFCRAARLDFADRDYFFTEARWQALAETLKQEAAGRADGDEARRHGTVGAVACDRAGNLAAATSTGGMTGKLPGRVGDSPIIGAGTYADNATCAVSATGHGEFFIRYAVAHEIAARIAHGGRTLSAAAESVVAELGRVGGSGGLVAVDRAGALALPFNCAGMYRGYAKDDGIVYTAIYDEDFAPA